MELVSFPTLLLITAAGDEDGSCVEGIGENMYYDITLPILVMCANNIVE